MSADPANEWVKKAEDNYVSALTLARRRRNPVPDVVCNQCQQCAEKYLKALLVRRAIAFPKTHDLIQLESLLAPIEPNIGLIHPALAVLNPYGIDIRYPGIDSTITDSRDAMKAVKGIRKFARAKLGLT
jgi:HEPN domain-containing protein